MPEAIPLIVYAAVEAGAVEAGFAAYAGYIAAAAAAVSAAVVAADQQKKARRRASSDRRDLTIMLQTASGPRRTVYGRAKLSGPLVYAYSQGVDHKFMHRVVVLTGHEIDAWEKIYFNDEDITPSLPYLPSTVPFLTTPQSGRYTENGGPVAAIAGFMGTASQSADAVLVSISLGQWTINHRLQGCAYLRIQNNYTPTVYTEGLPNPAALIRGKKLFDNRTGLTAWSENPALVIRDYLVAELGVPTARIDQASFDAAANLCDEWITLDTNTTVDSAKWYAYLHDIWWNNGSADGPWELVTDTVFRQRRYRFDGVVEADAAPGEVLDQMVQACAGWLSYTGGAWRLVAGGYTAPTLTLGESDLRAGPTFRPRPGRRDLYNVARGTYVGPGSKYVATDFPPPSSAAFVSADGGHEMPLDLDLPFTNEATAAQRLASIFLQRARQGVLTFPATLTGLALRPGDTVAINLPRFGFAGDVFRVEGWQLSEDYGVDLVLREEAAAIYTWSPDATIKDPSPNLNLPNPFSVPVVEGLTATSGVGVALVMNDGTIVPRTLVGWTPTENAFAMTVQLQVRQIGEVAWTPYPDAEDAAGQTYLLNLKTGVTYEIRARRINTVGAFSPWASINHASLPVNATDNLLTNADWDEDLGHALAYYPDTRSLRGWLPGYSSANPQFIRNYDNGRSWNLGKGGCLLYEASNVPGKYLYIYQDQPALAGIVYEASAYVLPERSNSSVYLWALDGANNALATYVDSFDAGAVTVGDPLDWNTHRRMWVKGQAPDGTAKMRVGLLVETTAQSAPYALSAWSKSQLCVAPPGVTRETATPWAPNARDTLHGGTIIGGTVTDVYEDKPPDGAVNWVNNNPNLAPLFDYSPATVIYTNTTPQPVPIVVTATCLCSRINGIQFNYVSLVTTLNGVLEVPTGVELYGTDESVPIRATFAATYTVIVPAGQTFKAEIRYRGERLAPGTVNTTQYWKSCFLNLQGIRK